MKKTYLLLVLISMALGSVAQNSLTPVLSADCCYDEYFNLFSRRGARPVTDGEQECIVTIRRNNVCECFLGKIQVQSGKMVPPLLLQLEDGSYERIGKKFSPKYQDKEAEIQNFIHEGMSPSYLSDHDEIINLFFIKFLNPKDRVYKQAPPASKF